MPVLGTGKSFAKCIRFNGLRVFACLGKKLHRPKSRSNSHMGWKFYTVRLNYGLPAPARPCCAVARVVVHPLASANEWTMPDSDYGFLL